MSEYRAIVNKFLTVRNITKNKSVTQMAYEIILTGQKGRVDTILTILDSEEDALEICSRINWTMGSNINSVLVQDPVNGEKWHKWNQTKYSIRKVYLNNLPPEKSVPE